MPSLSPSILDGEWDNADYKQVVKALRPNARKLILISALKAREEANASAYSISDSWYTLRAILERHEDVIRRRWGKKSQEQRKRTLLHAWPEILPKHRPDYKIARHKGQAPSHAYLIPYMNVEDLVQGKLLLLFLYSRGRNLPEKFAKADINAAHLGLVNLAIERPFFDGYTMLLHGQPTPDTYGRIFAWADHDDAYHWLKQGQGFQPGEGLLILGIQEKILKFLVTCCQSIMGDVSPRSLVGENVPIKSDPGPVPTDPTAWSSWAAISMEAPYRIPTPVDFRRLEAVIAAKFSAAKDHAWALREDPGYFAASVMEYSEHKFEHLTDAEGKKHPDFETPYFWNVTLKRVIIAAQEALFIWEHVRKQAARLCALNQTISMSSTPESNLSAEHADALLYFRFLIDRVAGKHLIGELNVIVPPSPPFRSGFVLQSMTSRSNEYTVTAKSWDMGEQKLLLILALLWDEDQRRVHSLPALVDELDMHLHKNLDENAVISPLVNKMVSDLYILTESLRQLDLWGRPSDADLKRADDRKDFKASYDKSVQPWGLHHDALNGISLADLGTPSQGFFHYPIDKPRTRGNVEAMRQAEHRPDAFWKHVDDHVAGTDENLRDLWLSFFKSDARKLQRTPEWVEKADMEEKGEARYIAFAQLDPDETTSRTLAVEERIKPKTRGIARPPSTSEAHPDPADQRTCETTIAVGKRALKVFSALFYTPSSQSDGPKEIPWSDFLHAMASTGFSVQKLYGSVWQFTPTKLDVEASIQFHEPHPSGKIPFVEARRHGRRLFRSYGWTSETFVQKE